jgi:uncharacterized damage-inducible protein DinB
MIYNSVADIFAANDEIRRRLIARVEGLGEDRHEARASEGGWSVAEIIEHLSLTERRVTKALEGMLPQVEDDATTGNGASSASKGAGAATTSEEAATTDDNAGGATASDGAARSFVPFSLADFVEQARDKKFEAPEFIRPRGVALPESLARLKESRAALEHLRPRFEAADYAAQFPHPAFGMLNVGQWLAFIGIHEERHLGQIKRLVETMNDER